MFKMKSKSQALVSTAPKSNPTATATVGGELAESLIAYSAKSGQPLEELMGVLLLRSIEDRFKWDSHSAEMDKIEDLQWIAFLDIPNGTFGIGFIGGKLCEIYFPSINDTPVIREGISISKAIEIIRDLYKTADMVRECVQHDYNGTIRWFKMVHDELGEKLADEAA